jgi:hypothetical protein
MAKSQDVREHISQAKQKEKKGGQQAQGPLAWCATSSSSPRLLWLLLASITITTILLSSSRIHNMDGMYAYGGVVLPHERYLFICRKDHRDIVTIRSGRVWNEGAESSKLAGGSFTD